jgi:hypothetical protein
METTGVIGIGAALSVGALASLQTALSSKTINERVDELAKMLVYSISLLNEVNERTRGGNHQQQDNRALASRVAVLEGQLANAMEDVHRLEQIVDSLHAPQPRSATRTTAPRTPTAPRTAKVQPAAPKKSISAQGRAAIARNTRPPASPYHTPTSSRYPNHAPASPYANRPPSSPYNTAYQQPPPQEEYQDDDSSVYADGLDPELLDALG